LTFSDDSSVAFPEHTITSSEKIWSVINWKGRTHAMRNEFYLISEQAALTLTRYMIPFSPPKQKDFHSEALTKYIK
jgi:hypothetical protein